MPRLTRGTEINPRTLDSARSAVADGIASVPLGAAMVKPVDLRRFDFLFPELQDDPANLLPEARKTRDDLVALGEAMADDGSDDPARDSNISAAYTYFGQFVDHDTTLETASAAGSQLTAPGLRPLPLGASGTRPLTRAPPYWNWTASTGCLPRGRPGPTAPG